MAGRHQLSLRKKFEIDSFCPAQPTSNRNDRDPIWQPLDSNISTAGLLRQVGNYWSTISLTLLKPFLTWSGTVNLSAINIAKNSGISLFLAPIKCIYKTPLYSCTIVHTNNI